MAPAGFMAPARGATTMRRTMLSVEKSPCKGNRGDSKWTSHLLKKWAFSYDRFSCIIMGGLTMGKFVDIDLVKL